MFYLVLTLDRNVFYTTLFMKTRGSASVVWDLQSGHGIEFCTPGEAFGNQEG